MNAIMVVVGTLFFVAGHTPAIASPVGASAAVVGLTLFLVPMISSLGDIRNQIWEIKNLTT